MNVATIREHIWLKTISKIFLTPQCPRASAGDNRVVYVSFVDKRTDHASMAASLAQLTIPGQCTGPMSYQKVLDKASPRILIRREIQYDERAGCRQLRSTVSACEVLISSNTMRPFFFQ
jgi:hypothetical protein